MNTQLQNTLTANSQIKDAAQASIKSMCVEATEIKFDHEATYSAEDDKLRIYFSYRLDSEQYERVKALGFRWAPKQGCNFAVWSPKREDFALEMAGEITAEGTTLAERAAAKAERLEDLAGKNARNSNSFLNAAHSISERFAYGQPILVGHHSERKARRDKSRMESAMRESNRCAGMVDYWNYKATAVEHHANYKNRDDVRARRIKTLLAELRSYQRVLNDSFSALKSWEKIEEQKGTESYEKNVLTLCGFSGMSPHLADQGSCWSRLSDGKITADEVVELSIAYHYRVIDGRSRARCIAHTLNRLAFERAELGEVERFEDDLTPVILQAFLREHGTDTPKVTSSESGFLAVSSVPFPAHICSDMVTDLDITADAWRDLMQSSGYEVPEKKERRKSKSTAASIPLITPTKEEAEKLQALWNAQIAAAVAKHKDAAYMTVKVADIKEISQAAYSANSKSEYDRCTTIEVDVNGKEVRMGWENNQYKKIGVPAFRVRIVKAGDLNKAPSVIVLTDKTGKTLPIEWSEVV